MKHDSELTAVLHGVTSARILLHHSDDPSRVVLRRTKRGFYGPTGGQLELGEHPVECAIRECREESRVRKIPELRFLTVVSFEGKGMWLSRGAWESWGYDLRGRHVKNGHVWVASIRTAVFSAPLAEPFRRRTVEGRDVDLVDLNKVELAQTIRPMYRDLLERWLARLQRQEELPQVLKISRLK